MSEGVNLTANVADVARCQALKPTEKDVIAAGLKVKRKYREDGHYSWSAEFKPNDHGKLTKDAIAVQEMMAPFTKADTERHLKLQAKVDRVAMRDANGTTQYVEPHKAEATAKANGWGHRWRGGGIPVERGPQGMMFRRLNAGWEPTGRLEVGVLGKPCPRRGLQFDPDGQPWRFLEGQWRPV